MATEVTASAPKKKSGGSKKPRNTVKPTVSGVMSGVPIPASGRGSNTYPFAQLREVGSMFFVQGSSIESMRGTCYQRSTALKKRLIAAGKEGKELSLRYMAKPHVAAGIDGVEDGTKGIGVWLVQDDDTEAT